MNRYNNGKIYKITDVAYTKCYIGSTCESLSQRMIRHKYHYTAYLKGTHKKTRSFELFDEFGIENCKIEWVEDYPCNSKHELEAREGYHIKNTDCVNKTILGRDMKQWREDNKDHIKQLKRAMYERHKDNDEFKEFNQQKSKEYYKTNKDTINEKRKDKRECLLCGASVRKSDMVRHQRTQKCQSFKI